MARKKRSYRRGYRAGRRSYRKKGLLGGIKLFDISQGLFNADQLGYIDAAESVMSGDFKGAGGIIVERAANPAIIFPIATGNLLIGVTRKVVHATGGKFVRRYIG